jgi:flagella basal body P-ring formation protein FlgA
MMLLRIIALSLLPQTALGDSLVAARTLPAGSVIGAGDVMLVDADIPEALTSVAAAVGQEARIAVYAGRPIRSRDLGAPTLVERNALVTLVYRSGGLTIIAEGRALDRAGEGETIRAMNLASKSTVSGRVSADGTIIVGGTN